MLGELASTLRIVGGDCDEGVIAMKGASARSITASVLGLAALPGGAAFPRPLAPSPVLALAGRWAGLGTMTPASGPAEPFKCVITYVPNSDGTQVKQNLRCKGEQSKIDAATQLLIDDGKVTGKWQDNIYSLDGTVSGTFRCDGLRPQARRRLLSGQHDHHQFTLRAAIKARPQRHERHEGNGCPC